MKKSDIKMIVTRIMEKEHEAQMRHLDAILSALPDERLDAPGLITDTVAALYERSARRNGMSPLVSRREYSVGTRKEIATRPALVRAV